MLAVSSEAAFFTGIAIVLLVGAILAGRWLAGRVATAPLAIAGIAVVTALALGALGGRVVDVVLAALLWGALILATILAATRLRGVAAIAAGAIGGMIAVQAAVVTFVAAGFSAQEAPREYALLWLPAMTGLAKDLGGPDVTDEMPLWVRISQDAGLVSWLIVLLTGFALAYAVRRGRVARIQTSQA